MNIYIKLFEVLFPVFFVIGIGYYLGKKNSKIDTSFITNFAANIGTPAMIIYAVTSTGITFDIFKEYFWYYLLAIILFAVVGIPTLYFLKTKDITRELPPLILPNTGNMGVPICLFAYGSEGLGVSASIASLIIFFHFTVGVFLADRKFNLHIILKNPPFYSIIFSAFVLYFNISLPIVVINTTEWLMYATIFLILMSLGIALTRLKVFSLKKAVISSLVRMILGPVIGFINIFLWFIGICSWCFIDSMFNTSAVLNYLVGRCIHQKKLLIVLQVQLLYLH